MMQGEIGPEIRMRLGRRQSRAPISCFEGRKRCGQPVTIPLSCTLADLPQATLINGQGFYGDCQLNPVVAGNQGALSLPCNLTTVTVLPDESAQQPWASAANPGADRV